MDLVLTGRGEPITADVREIAERKVEKFSRLHRRVGRVEIEVISEHNPRVAGKRVEGSLAIPRKTFRAHGEAPDVERALDQLVQRLERQLRDHHDRKAKRWSRRRNRLESARNEKEPEPGG